MILLFKDEKVDIIEEIDVVSFEPLWGDNVADEEEHQEDVVEVDLVDSGEEYGEKDYHVEVRDQLEEYEEGSRAVLASEFLEKLEFLFLSIEAQILSALDQEKEGGQA